MKRFLLETLKSVGLKVSSVANKAIGESHSKNFFFWLKNFDSEKLLEEALLAALQLDTLLGVCVATALQLAFGLPLLMPLLLQILLPVHQAVLTRKGFQLLTQFRQKLTL